jgi:NCS1 family nucleobase:cation symporter-1
MDTGLDLNPVPRHKQTASFWDVAALFAGANIVTTTLVTGGSLAPAFSFRQTLGLILVGVLIGTAPIAVLGRLGPRFGLPTMVLLRHPFGRRGAALISLLLIVTNFAWIALNNVIAAEAFGALLGGPRWFWSLTVGGVAILIAIAGPRAMALFDKVAVPLLIVVGAGITWALFAGPGREALGRAGTGSLSWLAGLDIVIGYQVSWSLMFADYTRYQANERRASRAITLGLTLSSLWLMVIGAGAGIVGGGNSPTDMILALGLPAGALLLMGLSTITTNFVNIYLSSLALKNLWPAAPEWETVFAMGGLGTALGLLSPSLLDRYAGFMGWIATLLLPLLAVAIAYFFDRRRSPGDSTAASRRSPGVAPAWRLSGMTGWLAGVLTYQLLTRLPWRWGATLPTLAVAALVYLATRRVSSAPRGAGA